LLLIVVCALAAVAFVALVPAGPRAETFLEIAPGTSSRQIAFQLEKQHLIWSRYAFDALRIFKRGTLKAGEYRFDHPATLSEVYRRLLRGDVYTLSVTIPEGANIFDVAQRVEAAGLGNRQAVLKAALRDSVLVRDLDPGARSLEGYLFPDTYRFPRVATPDQIAAAMVKRFRLAAVGLGLRNGYFRAVPAGERVGVHQAVTMASLVERETPIPQERPMVASVFVNRLERGMPLMTDPSVIYAALLEGRYRGTIFQSDLASDSAYNTYRHAGLPPGPICNPGLASLRAAISPAKTDYLYFVAATADPSGHSRFSATLAEHARDVQAYRQSLHWAGHGAAGGAGGSAKPLSAGPPGFRGHQ
jgi:UPF0755 protein